jgi:uncharacterized protein YdiU (UPF0061 family)
MTAWQFDNSYRRLPAAFHSPLAPTPVADPRLLALNQPLATELGLDLDISDVELFAGNELPDGAQPIAMAYAGHQFGNFVPQLGDGRAILLGEIHDRAGLRRDIQLKGAGPTPFSRNGDGRAAIGPVLREYLLSEAMHALGIPTTRALAAVATGEPVYRETALPGAVLTRVAASHVRVGTFQFFAAREDNDAVRQLADYVIERHHPQAAEAEQPYLALLDAVSEAQARLVARWMQVGFIHGVMNTDNITVSGETIDYGPCAFMDSYAPGTVFSSIDQAGRYAYANQPPITQWNLARLAETLLPLINSDKGTAITHATESLNRFGALFQSRWLAGLRAKIGLDSAEPADEDLINALLDAMHKGRADFTNTFRGLCDAAFDRKGLTSVRAEFDQPELFDDWVTQWRDRLEHESLTAEQRTAAMRQVNPAVIPRNHLVERALAASLNDDLAPFEDLLRILQNPFEDPDSAEYTKPPQPEEQVLQTFCGT